VFNAWLGGLSLDAFIVGKMDLHHVRFVERGIAEGVFKPARFLPLFYRDQNRLKLTQIMTRILHRRELEPLEGDKPPPPVLQTDEPTHPVIRLIRKKRPSERPPRSKDLPDAAEES
jgi:hypothetical protein